MVDYDVFDRRLADALRDYAAEGPIEIDAIAVARTIASGRPRRSGWRAMALPSFRRSPLMWVLLATLLLLGTGLALVAVGSLLTRDDFAVDPEHPIPQALTGEFEVQLAVPGPAAGYLDYVWFVVDLDADHFLHGPNVSDASADIRGPDDATASWAGRVVAFNPTRPGAGELLIHSTGRCEDARYLLLFDDEGITFTQPDDPCPDRVAILTTTSWRHRAPELTAGQRYGSWSFTEPFHFLMPPASPPASARTPPVSARTWLAPGQLSLGSAWWRGEFLDDWTLPIDRCDPGAGSLPDIPPNAQALESWFRSNGRSIDEAIEIEVDGRTAMRYRTSESICPGEEPNTFGNRWYLIQTGDDTILFDVYGDTAAEYQVADEIVRSMTFD
jgi:hypothetical protein